MIPVDANSPAGKRRRSIQRCLLTMQQCIYTSAPLRYQPAIRVEQCVYVSNPRDGVDQLYLAAVSTTAGAAERHSPQQDRAGPRRTASGPRSETRRPKNFLKSFAKKPWLSNTIRADTTSRTRYVLWLTAHAVVGDLEVAEEICQLES